MRKRLLAFALVFALMLTLAQGVSFASFNEGDEVRPGTTVNIAYQDNTLDYMTMNGTVKSMRYTYFYFKTKDGAREEHPVYCVAPDMKGAYELVRDDGTTGDAPNTAKYTTGEKVTRTDYVKVMESGYPHNNYTSFGLNSEEEGYYATKMALWMFILQLSPDSGKVGLNASHPDQAAAQRVYNAAVAIYKAAQEAMWAGINDPAVEIVAPTSANSWQIVGDYYEMTLTVKTNGYMGNNSAQSDEVQLSWDTSTGALPPDTVVLNSTTDITTTMKPLPANAKQEGIWHIQTITIRVPTEVIEAYKVNNPDATVMPMPTLKVLAKDMTGANFYIATYDGGRSQPYIIEADRKVDVANAFQTTVPIKRTLENDPHEMGLRIIKRETGTLIPLSGAVFEIYNPRGQLIQTLSTDSNGEIFLALGEAGLFTVKEISPSQYHVLPTHTSAQVQVDIDNTATVTFVNDPYGSLRIEKRDAAFGYPLSGAVVQIKHIVTGAVKSAATDYSGVVEFLNLPVGGYEILELSAPQGYSLDTAVHTVSVLPQTQGTSTFTLTNKANPGLRIIKLDRQKATPIEGVTFEVWRDGALLGEYQTDYAGEIYLPNLPAGTYLAREVSTVEPYVLDATAQWVQLTAGQGYISELIFMNDEKPGIRLIKLDSETLKPIVNAKFVVHQVSGGLPAGQAGGYHQEHITDKNGEVSLEHLDPGVYQIWETVAPSGFLIDDAVRTIEILAGKPDARFVFTNTKKPSLEILKYDPATGKYLPGATFRIARIEDGTHYLDRVTDATGRIVIDDLEPGVYSVVEEIAPDGYIRNAREFHVELFPGKTSRLVVENIRKPSLIVKKYDMDTALSLAGAEFSIAKIGGQIIYEGVTDSGGEIRLNNLDVGWYTITELAPPHGYLVTTAPKNVYLEPGKTVEVKFDDLRCPALDILKYDPVEAKYLPGAAFRIARVEAGTNYLDRITDAEGRIHIEGLLPGVYSVREVSPPSGYILNDTEYHVELFAGKTSQLVVENVKKPSLIVKKYDLQTALPLPGAEFSIANKGGSVIYEGVAADSTIRLDNLEAGWVTVTELAPPPGYLLPTPASRDVYLEPGKVTEIKFDDIKCPTLTIQKLDSVTHDPIKNVRFNVKFSPNVNFSGGVVDLGGFVTNESGQIVLNNNLQAGWYRVTETAAAAGYILKPPTTQDLFLNGGENKTMTFENIPKSALVIRKIDSATGVPVQGATFTVRYLAGTSGNGGTVIFTGVTSVNGTIVLTGLQPGTYIAEETKPATDYELSNPAVQTAYINGDDQSIVELVFEDAHKGGLLIKKLNSVTKQPIAGVTFKVTYSSGAVIGPNNGEYTTDAEGLINVAEPLTVGATVIVQEIKCPDEYVIDTTEQSVQIKENTLHTLTFYNSPKSGLQIVKIDSVTKEPLKGAKFSIYKKSGDLLGDYETDGNGLIIVPTLEPGWVKIVETEAPSGYVRDDTPKDVEITSNQFLKMVFENVPQALLQILKIDEETRRPIPNTEFALSKMNGERVGVYITDSRGQILVQGLDSGWYAAVETKAANGYLADTAPRNIEVTNGKTAVLTVTNKKASGILIHKIDSITKQGIYGVTFLLYNDSNAPVGQYESDQDGYVYINGTGGNALPEGKYRIRELTPAQGYAADDTVRTIYLEYGRTTEITWENVPVKGQVIVTKRSAAYNEVTGLAAGSALAGAVFEVYSLTGNLVDRMVSDNRGIAASNPIPLGVYVIKEVSPPKYYALNPREFLAELKHNGDIVRFELLDENVALGVTIDKKSQSGAVAGQTIYYDLFNIANTSTAPLANFYVHDRLPTDAGRGNKVFTGTWSDRLTYRVTYKTNYSADYKVLASGLSTKTDYELSIHPNVLGLSGGEYVTDVRFEFGTVPSGFRSVKNPKIELQLLYTLPKDYKVVNRADVGGLYIDEWETAQASWVTVVTKGYDPPPLPKTGY